MLSAVLFMQTRALLILVAVLALIAALWIALTPDDVLVNLDSRGGEAGLSSALAAEGEASAAEIVGDAELATAAGSNAAGQRDEVRTGHRVQVLGADGEPVAGVRVAALKFSEESRVQDIAFWSTRLDTVASFGSGDGIYPQTDEEGMVQLDTFESCMVYVSEFERAGFILLEKPGPESDQEVHTLALRHVPMVEVQVLEADGGATTAEHQFRATVATAESASKLTEDAQVLVVHQVWMQSDNQVLTISDGRRVFVLQPSTNDLKRLQNQPGPYRFRLRLAGTGIAPQEQDLQQDAVGPVRFMLPAFGQVLIRIAGAPKGLIPSLLDQEAGFGFSQSTEQNDGTFLFERVAVGTHWRVGAMLEVPGSSRRKPTSTILGEVAGPSTSGQRVEYTLQYQHPPGFHGRFIFPDGVDPGVLATQGRADVMILFDDEQRQHMGAIWADSNVFADGTFTIATDRIGPPNTPAGTVTGIEALFRGAKGPKEDWNTADAMYCLWAEAPAHLPSPDASVDLGDVPLQFGNELLHLKVLNRQGEPVQDAQVRLTARVARDIERGPGRHSQNFERAMATDADGRCRVVHRDWFRGFQMQRYHDPKSPEGAIESVRVTVSHGDYLEQSKIIPVGESEMEITLEGSATIEGSVQPMAGITGVDVTVVAPGQAWDRRVDMAGMGSYGADFRGKEDQESVGFKITSVPEGSWDVVFLLTSGNRSETYRVPHVNVVAGEVCRDPRLQSVELAKQIDLVRLGFRDPTGAALTKFDSARFNPRIMVRSEGGSFGNDPLWIDDMIVYPVAKAQTMHPTISAKGWLAVDLGELGAGEHLIKMHPSVRVRLELEDADRLPAGNQISVSGRLRGALGAWERMEFQNGVTSTFELQACGEISLNWRVGVGADSRHVCLSTLQLPLQDIVDGMTIRVPIPDAVLQALED
jgi:hypothetical protein